MPEATVILPTHDHAATLPYAVRSVQQQTVRDLEIVVVGDGVGDDTRSVVKDLMSADPRIRFLDRPKGERHGERHRHEALADARGAIVCYACDDDLWLPWHVETLRRALAEADFAHTLALSVGGDGETFVTLFDAAHPGNRRIMERHQVGFGLANGGHTLEAYRRLTYGWRPAPPDVNTDLFMWRQFMDMDGCRVRSVSHPTVVHFGTPFRRHWTARQRVAELERWLPRIEAPDAERQLLRFALEAAGTRYGASTALRCALHEIRQDLRAVRRGRVWRYPRLSSALYRTLRLFRV